MPQLVESAFKTLRIAYPTWASLRAYLTSVEGGQLTVSYQNERYALICYTKGKSDLTRPHVRLFRSVVWDVAENLPVSVTAPKSEMGESFPTGGDYAVVPFYDGIMVGLFRCNYTGQTILHTRTYFGGGNTFYSKTTFGEMFAEAMPTLLTLLPGQSLTYILQHPENRVVTPIDAPRAILVHTAHVQTDGLVDSSPTWEHDAARPFGGGETRADILRRYRTAGALDQGLCILSLGPTYKRYKLRTPAYNAVRLLRGNNASLDYTWLSLWQSSTIHDYLKAYPEERTKAMALIQSWKTASGEVFRYYEDVFKRHTLTMAQVPRKYKPLLFQLHEQYKTTRTPIAWASCKAFMNSRDVPQMLYILRWDVRTALPSAPALSASAILVLATSDGANALVTPHQVAATEEAVATDSSSGASEGLVVEQETLDELAASGRAARTALEACALPPPPSMAPLNRVMSAPVV